VLRYFDYEDVTLRVIDQGGKALRNFVATISGAFADIKFESSRQTENGARCDALAARR